MTPPCKKTVLDAKCDYPSACNAMETLLLDRCLVESSDSGSSFFVRLINELKRNGVQIYSGPELSKMLTFGPPAAKSLKTEYGSLACTLEVVDGLDNAIEYINHNGSGHTDSIVTENGTKIFSFHFFSKSPNKFLTIFHFSYRTICKEIYAERRFCLCVSQCFNQIR